MNMFRLLTPVAYWVLIVMWSFILFFYIQRIRSKQMQSHFLLILMAILAIDAFQTLFESLYFGVWYTSLAGLLPTGIHDFLISPENVFIPKFINVMQGILVIILLRRWIPEEGRERERQRNLMRELKETIEKHKRTEEELSQAKKEAELANRTKSDFLTNMSHELRTPLNAIIGFSEVLEDKHFGPLTEKQEEYIKDIQESGKHQLSLINDILDLSKVEAGKMELELSKVNLRSLLENSLIMVKEKAYKHGISVDLQIPGLLSDLEIQADERKLKQVMFNLLSNAAKFTPDGGSIIVEVKQDGEELIVSVSDTGIGIAPEDQERIFEEFYQVCGGATDKTPGTGLGLPLTKRLVEMHGWRICVEGEGLGKGSRFSITLSMKSIFMIEPTI